MGLVAWIAASISPRARRLARLAQIGGDSERLARSLSQHAARCKPPRIKEGLETLAAAEAANANALRDLILARGAWPLRSLAPVADGSSNWARLNADLAASVELVRALDAAVAEWEGADQSLAERLRELAAARENRIALLRDLATKCDPQALD
jgi:hypothetical protein